MKFLKYTAFALTILGALNWGLIGLFGFNLVAALFGDMTVLSRIIYSLVGVSAIVAAVTMHHCDTVIIDETCECKSCNF